MVFDELELWKDTVPRAGPEAMAVDEWLLGICTRPLLRVYEWKGNWGSLGYFGSLETAHREVLDRDWVRRWTGGGIVDHVGDWTYSLIVPRGHAFAALRASESYQLVHEALADVLRAEGDIAILSNGMTAIGGLCFENPVPNDVEDGSGRKIAGAAQRRYQGALLHQGSVRGIREDLPRAENFAEKLARNWSEVQIFADADRVGTLAKEKYSTEEWLGRR